MPKNNAEKTHNKKTNISPLSRRNHSLPPRKDIFGSSPPSLLVVVCACVCGCVCFTPKSTIPLFGVQRQPRPMLYVMPPICVCVCCPKLSGGNRFGYVHRAHLPRTHYYFYFLRPEPGIERPGGGRVKKRIKQKDILARASQAKIKSIPLSPGLPPPRTLQAPCPPLTGSYVQPHYTIVCICLCVCAPSIIC